MLSKGQPQCLEDVLFTAVANSNVRLKPSDETEGPGPSPDLPLASWWCGPNNPSLSLCFGFAPANGQVGVGWGTAILATPAQAGAADPVERFRFAWPRTDRRLDLQTEDFGAPRHNQGAGPMPLLRHPSEGPKVRDGQASCLVDVFVDRVCALIEGALGGWERPRRW